MRVALVSTPFVSVPPRAYGGTELVVHALSRALSRAGHDVTVFATGDSRVPGARAFFGRAVWPPDPHSELLHCRFAAREIVHGDFDVVHAHVPAMLAFADELPSPTVYTVHHVADPVMARFYAAAPRVRSVAISLRQAALLSPEPDDVVHHGLDPGMYPTCGPGGDAALFVGRLAWVKAPEVAVDAARRAGLPIVLAGRPHAADAAPDGWRERVLEPALRAPGVRWLAAAGLAAKRRLFAASRALLVPLRWEEPFGLVMIEALLAGCPVVAFARGAAPEIVEEGVTGYLVEGVDDMARALSDAGALDRAAIQAHARRRFSADRMASGYLAVYRAAIAAHRGPRAALTGGGWTTAAP
ncbi:MAG TPA: glycosyltransferase family 4 protein [Anaeromyxobacter sp.]|nr:glycosyltransferase family 4 protein [Anaeromyxobacter sp.]